MQQLGSNNYETVNVHLKDETIVMPADNGYQLMQYLTRENTGSHVMITDTSGVQVVLNKNDIRKISPVIKSKSMKTPAELGMNTDRRGELGDGYAKYQALKKRMTK